MIILLLVVDLDIVLPPIVVVIENESNQMIRFLNLFDLGSLEAILKD